MFKQCAQLVIEQTIYSCLIKHSVRCLHRYDSSTGTFTVPAGGDGFYYFSVYFTVWYYKFARFDMQVNGERICTAYADQSESPDNGHASCSAATYVAAGKKG